MGHLKEEQWRYREDLKSCDKMVHEADYKLYKEHMVSVADTVNPMMETTNQLEDLNLIYEEETYQTIYSTIHWLLYERIYHMGYIG